MNKNQQIVEEINSLLDIDFKNLQSFAGGKSLKLDVQAEISPGVFTIKIYSDFKILRFLCWFEPGAFMELHWHDCTEIVNILSGQLADEKTGAIYEINERIVFAKGQKHKPFNPSNKRTYLLVEFIK